jgi:hypothetical protein
MRPFAVKSHDVGSGRGIGPAGLATVAGSARWEVEATLQLRGISTAVRAIPFRADPLQEAVSKPQLNAEETSAHNCRRKHQKPAVDVGTALVADSEATEPMHPCEASFHDPEVASKALRGLDAMTRDSWDDASCATG